MHFNINEAKTNLSQLVNKALAGKEVIISRFNEPLVKLTPVEQDTSPRIGGQWKGKVKYECSVAEMDREIETLFDNSTVFPDGDV